MIKVKGGGMDDKEFRKKLRKLAKKNNVEFYETRQGKGSHSRIYYDGRFTTLKKGELGQGLLRAMCQQLGINKDDL
ncbi:type II toxin-antitoxin system HicA family toxin [Crocosphaera subtropica]|uniref:type II toxin-antitoxin system HicA family toxin n=1 Tax=Crocosphaera subtropica TaxID=2546360 RepID=UPI000231377B|nr:type II toxin-antitoxin system HicA family toxin [Crocosphaera subtropica]